MKNDIYTIKYPENIWFSFETEITDRQEEKHPVTVGDKAKLFDLMKEVANGRRC